MVPHRYDDCSKERTMEIWGEKSRLVNKQARRFARQNVDLFDPDQATEKPEISSLDEGWWNAMALGGGLRPSTSHSEEPFFGNPGAVGSAAAAAGDAVGLADLFRGMFD